MFSLFNRNKEIKKYQHNAYFGCAIFSNNKNQYHIVSGISSIVRNEHELLGTLLNSYDYSEPDMRLNFEVVNTLQFNDDYLSNDATPNKAIIIVVEDKTPEKAIEKAFMHLYSKAISKEEALSIFLTSVRKESNVHWKLVRHQIIEFKDDNLKNINLFSSNNN